MYRVTDHSARAIYLIITIQNCKSLQTILIGTVNIYIELDSSTPQLSNQDFPGAGSEAGNSGWPIQGDCERSGAPLVERCVGATRASRALLSCAG